MAVAACLGLLHVPLSAFAENPHPADEKQRAALYQDGIAFANEGRWEEAVKKFRQVIAMRSAPPALFTLGQAEEHTGELATATHTYERALGDARRSGNGEVAEAAKKALLQLEPRVPRVLVNLALPAPGATATLDGVAVSIGTPATTNPGDHAVAVTAPGRIPFASKLHLAEGQTFEVSAVLATEARPIPPRPEPSLVSPAPPERSSHVPIGPVVVGGIGVAAVVVGLVVRLGSQSSYDSARSQCEADACSSEALVDKGNEARNQMIAGTAVLGAVAAALVGAGTWWALAPRHRTDSAVGFAIVPTSGGARASVGGSF